MTRLVLLFLTLFIVGSLATESTTTEEEQLCEREAILLHNIKEIDVASGLFTNSRREAAIPQLECIGGSAKGHYEPLAARCVNIGHLSPHWRCEATLDDTVRLGSVVVTCEGYQGPSDPYVLRNSCAVRYTLEYRSWTSYVFGYFLQLVDFLVVTPLKWLLTIAFIVLVGFIATAVIRRPAHRGQKQSTPKNSLSFVDILFGRSERANNKGKKHEEKSESEDLEQSPWKGRLRPRSQIHSPVAKDVDSPYNAPISTGMAAR